MNSSEILSKTSLGSSTAGDGSLSNYAVVTESAFDTDTYTIARIRYDNLKNVKSIFRKLQAKVADKQDELDDLLSDNAEQRLASLKSDAQVEVDANQERLIALKRNWLRRSRLLLVCLLNNKLPHKVQLTKHKLKLQRAKAKFKKRKLKLMP